MEFVPVAIEMGDVDWLFEVRIHGVLVGRIRRYPQTYRYYRAHGNYRDPLHEEKDLELLLQLVADRP